MVFGIFTNILQKSSYAKIQKWTEYFLCEKNDPRDAKSEKISSI